MSKRTLKKVAVTAATFIFGFALTTATITHENEGTITAFLNQTDAIIEKGELPEGFDLEYGYKSKYKSIKELVKGGFQIQEKEEAEGAVLLTNKNNALPLARDSKVSVFGITGASPFYGAGGSGGINTSEAIGWYDAFRGFNHEGADPKDKNQGAKFFDINENLATAYTNWANSKHESYKAEYMPSSSQTKVNIGDVPFSEVEKIDGFANDVATYGDAAIYVIKRTGGEGYDLPATTGKNAQYGNENYASPVNLDEGNSDYLALSKTERGVLEGLKALKAAGKIKKIVLLLNMASTIELDFLESDKYDIDACMLTGSVGEVGTIAVAKLLTGEYNPSAGASSTLWKNNLKNPVNNNFCDQNYFFTYPNYKEYGFINPAEDNAYQSTMSTYMVYQEGVYLGYKYTETRYEDYVLGKDKVGDYKYNDVVSFPFGYGLSYTSFEYTNLEVKDNGSNLEVSVTVKNTGNVAGKTPVQIYLAKPYNDYAKKNKIQVPSVELINFGKTDILEPGKTETVKVTVSEKYFASYDTNGAGTYVITGGDYYLIAAQDAHEATNSLLAVKGHTPSSTGGKMDAEGNKSLAHKVSRSFDKEKYSLSSATGLPIRNHFGFADINTYEGRGDNKVEYYSREDWVGTALELGRNPDGTLIKNNPKFKMTAQMASELKDQMDASKVIKKGGEYPTMGAKNGLTLLSMRGIEFENPQWEKLLDEMTWDEMVDLLSNGRHKTVAVESVAKPTTADENGPNGFGVRNYNVASSGSSYSGPTHPYAERVKVEGQENPGDPDIGKNYTSTGFSSNGVLASTFNKEIAKEVGRQIGEEGYWAGNAGLLGGGFNIQRSPYAGRTAEYYSEDAMLTGLIGAPETKEIEGMGVHCFVKHCALNESETGRHGIQEWINEQALRENYLRAFEIVIEEGGAFNVMTAFNRIGTIAVANSDVFAKEWLRNEAGLPGIIETDCAGDMTDGKHGEAYVSRICNVYTGASELNEYNYAADAPDYTGSTYTYASFAPDANGKGEYGNLAQAMRQASKRILYATLTSNAICGYSTDTRFIRVTPPWVKVMAGVEIGTGVLLGAALLWVIADGALLLLKSKKK